jgi:hypothetical protein
MRKNPDHLGPTAHVLVQPCQRIRRRHWWPMVFRNGHRGQHLIASGFPHVGGFRKPRASARDHSSPFLAGLGLIRLHKDRFHERRHSRWRGPRALSSPMAHPMDPAAWPRSALEPWPNGLRKTPRGIADHAWHATPAPGHSRPSKGRPEGGVLTPPDVEASHLPIPGW